MQFAHQTGRHGLVIFHAERPDKPFEIMELRDGPKVTSRNNLAAGLSGGPV